MTTTPDSLEKIYTCLEIRPVVINMSLKSVVTLKSPNLYVGLCKSRNTGRSLQSDIKHRIWLSVRLWVGCGTGLNNLLYCGTEIYHHFMLSTLEFKTYTCVSTCKSPHNISSEVRIRTILCILQGQNRSEVLRRG